MCQEILPHDFPACAASFSGRLDSAPMVLSLTNPGQRPSLLCAGFDRLAPEGRRAVATGGARLDDSRAKRNPWFPGPSPDSPGRGDKEASTAVAPAGAIGDFRPYSTGSASVAATAPPRRSTRGYNLMAPPGQNAKPPDARHRLQTCQKILPHTRRGGGEQGPCPAHVSTAAAGDYD